MQKIKKITRPTKMIIGLTFSLILIFLVCLVLKNKVFGSVENKYSETQYNKGQELFFMKVGLNNFSCSSCHLPPYYVDNLDVGVGHLGETGTRNTPSILNTKFEKEFFWDGREKNLQSMILIPFFNIHEMGLKTEEELLNNIEKISGKRKTIEEVAIELSHFIENINLEKEIKYNKNSIGYQKFIEHGCHTCHQPDNSFKDDQYHYFVSQGNIHDLGNEIFDEEKTRDNIFTNMNYSNLGRYIKTKDINDIGKFKTPSLYYVSRTAPYYHNGSQKSLMEVIKLEFYYRNPDKSQMSESDAEQIALFLNSLEPQ